MPHELERPTTHLDLPSIDDAPDGAKTKTLRTNTLVSKYFMTEEQALES